MRRRSATTVLELLLAFAIGALVLGAIVALAWYATASLVRSGERGGPRESAHMALTTLATTLRDAWQYSIEDGGSGIRFCTPRMEGEARLDAAAGKLMFRAPGRPKPETLVERGVEAFRIEAARPGCLRLTLRISRPERTGKMKSLAALTVVEEVFLPAIAMRDPAVPWSRALEHRKALEPSG